MSDQPQTPRTLRSPDWAQARQAAFDAAAALPPHWLPLGETVGETLAEDLRAERLGAGVPEQRFQHGRLSTGATGRLRQAGGDTDMARARLASSRLSALNSISLPLG